MWWLVLPVAASVFYCFNGYIQNYLTDVALPKKRAGSLAIMHALSFLVSIIALIFIFGRAVFMMPLGNALGLMMAGAINVTGAIFYYKAIQKGDNIDVTIFGQVAPLISIGLARFSQTSSTRCLLVIALQTIRFLRKDFSSSSSVR